MRGRQAAMVRAYAWPAAWILAGFVLAEILQRVAVSTGTHWPAVVAVWLSLLALLAGTARALRVTWRFWRARPAAPTNRNED